jgi:outer membrane protein OmpA-like peptidoglycan-associated protein
MLQKILLGVGVLFFVSCGGEEDIAVRTQFLACKEVKKITICVYPDNPKKAKTIEISRSDWKHHQKRGAHLGECTCEELGNCPPPPVCGDNKCDPHETCESCECDCGECPPPPPFCGDGECDDDETCESCEHDCGKCPPPPPFCGDGNCDSHESCKTCKKDCGKCPPPPPFCGDHECGINETCESCEKDCGECPPPPHVCGDGKCDIDESCLTCEEDCGECPYPPCPDAGVVDSGLPGDDLGVVDDAGVPDANQQDQGVTPQEDSGTPNGADAGPTPPVNPNDSLAFAGGCSAAGSGASAFSPVFFLAMLLMLCVALYSQWSVKMRSVILLLLALLAVASFLSTAQSQTLPNIQTQRLSPAWGSSDFIGTQDGKVSLSSVKLFYQYEKDPLVVNRLPGNQLVDRIIERRHTLHVMGAFSWKMFQFGVGLPVVLHQEQWGNNRFQNGIGDIRLGVKVRLLRHNSFRLSMALDGSLPTATAEMVGERNGSFSPKVIVSGRLWKIDLAANAGFRLRSDESFTQPGFQNLSSGQLFVGSVAGRLPIVQRKQFGLSFVSDLMVATTMEKARNISLEDVPVEWLNGLNARLNSLNFMLGAGASLTRGLGSPQPRLFASLSYSFGKCKKCAKPKVVVKEKEKVIVRKEVVVVNRLLMIPPVYFDTDKSELRDSSKRILDRVVEMLKDYPQIHKVRIEGYTDHRASAKYNQKLSKRRVDAVVDYLKGKGVKLEKVERRHFGENHQIDSGKTTKGMQKNRRVEFFISGRRK